MQSQSRLGWTKQRGKELWVVVHTRMAARSRLSQRAIPAFKHAPFLLFLSQSLHVARATNDRLVGTPKIGVAMSSTSLLEDWAAASPYDTSRGKAGPTPLL